MIPYKLRTDKGIFDDGLEADGDVLFRCMPDTITVRSECPTVQEYETFFAKHLSKAKTILHISMAKHRSQGYANACETAKAFYNVTVMDSGHLSSGQGLLVLDAAALLKSAPLSSPEDLKTELEEHIEQIQTSFLLENTEYLYRSGRLLNSFCRAFMVHPMIVVRDSKLFITCAGMRQEEAEALCEEVQSVLRFETVYLQKVSPSICANCGSGTFGLLFERVSGSRETAETDDAD